MKPIIMAIIVAVVDLALFAALVFGDGHRDDALVLCRDADLGRLSAYMDVRDVTPTADGWVLYFPNARISPHVQVWAECEVHQ